MRPPLFHSAYEAAAWAVLSARRPRDQMLKLRQQLSEAHGTSFDIAGRSLAAFPTPEKLLAEIVWPHFWAVQIILLVLILMYCSMHELVRVIGKERILRIFFGPVPLPQV